jgi:hypothetical protein
LGLVGTGLNGLVGFHPSDVTSRLLALWPMCILATFVFFCRSWSRRGALLLALALAPFAALLVLQVAGAPRDPPFAVSWVATALPMLAIGLGRALSLTGRWSTSRLLGAIAVAALVVAGADQAARADPVDRFAVAPAIDETARAGPGDVVVYAPESLGDLVRRRVDGATVVTPAAATAEDLAHARRVYVLGAFGFADDPSLDRVLDLVHSISADRRLIVESEHHEAKVWIFE